MKKLVISKNIFILLILPFVLMATMCQGEDENHHKSIRFTNNTDKAIYVIPSFAYPDTLNGTGMGRGGLNMPYKYKILPGTENRDALRMREFWEVIFSDERRIPSDTLMVYVFDAELLESQTTNIVNTIIQRYDLSLQDLQYLNWTLTYPPSPNMSSIKMYPPYKE